MESLEKVDKRSGFQKLANKVPHTYVLIFIIILLASLMTYVVPAGQFDRVEFNGRMAIVPDSYHTVEKSPVNFMTILMSFQMGMISASDIVFFVFIIGGSVGILRSTKAVDALLVKVIYSAKGTGSGKVIIAVTTLFFGFLGGFVGLYEEALGFMPFTIMIALSLKYDAVVGIAMGLLGMCSGFAAGPLNPFTVGVAQGIAELPMFSGLWLRLIAFAVMEGVTIWYIISYAEKVRKDPSLSYVYGSDYSDMELEEDPEKLKLNSARIRVLFVFFATFVIMLLGLTQWGWYINELSGLFLGMGIFSALFYGMKLNEMGSQFVRGAEYLLYGALLIGAARGIMVILEQGMILDSVVYYMVKPLASLPTVLASSFMVIIQTFINFFIPSGSGQAMVTMPIMTPMADLLGINRQVAVLAFQFGDGLSNMMIPTLGATMACLGIARMEYGKWVAFAGKLFLIQMAIAIGFMIFATLINYGPF